MTELSTRGAWLPTSEPLPEGTLVELGLCLDGEERTLRGEVMWAESAGRRAGMGIEWLDVDEAGREWLAQALADRPDVEGHPSRFAYADAC